MLLGTLGTVLAVGLMVLVVWFLLVFVFELSVMTRPWQIAALIIAVIFGIRGFLAWEGKSNSKPEIAFAAMAIIGYLVVWFIYLIAKRIRQSA